MKKLISIIIPTFNRGHLINETIKSVLTQTFEEWELILVDDGSSDNTKEIIQKYLSDPRIILVDRPVDRKNGGNAARNYGYELAKGKYIKWLDSDDLLAPDCLKKQFDFIIKSNADVVFCRSRFFSSGPNGERVIGDFWNQGFLNENVLPDFIKGKIRFSNNDGLWRRTILGKKPFLEDLRNSQEFLMIIKILANGARVALQDEVLIFIRKHEAQMHSNRRDAFFCKNQILARQQVIKELKKNGKKNGRIFLYLLKSQTYYLIRPLKKKEFQFFFENLYNYGKSIFHILLT